MAEQWLEVSVGIAAWYLTSFGTLLLNKYLLGSLHIQPNTLAVVQMVSTAIYGALKTVRPRELMAALREAWPVLTGGIKNSRASTKVLPDGSAGDPEDPTAGKAVVSTWQRSFAQIGFVGAMRFATVILGLVSLKNIAASFTETIKASAPFFTVVIAFLMLGERTSLKVVASLMPVALGLVMVSYTELSFNIIGFSAAVATNVIECVQNVFSKRLLAREYSASQLQFYTSLTALVLQAPIFVYSYKYSAGQSAVAGEDSGANATALDAVAPPEFEWTRGTIALLWIDGVLYHLQSVVAYVVMSYLSPVTVSVVNTLKRALIIGISVLVFQNKVTPGAAMGTGLCLLGALWYNFARQQQTQVASSCKASTGSSPQRASGGADLWKDKR